MGCPKTTPADSPHEIHDGTRIGPGVFVHGGTLCVHRDPEGADQALLASITLEPRFVGAVAYASEAKAFDEAAVPEEPVEAKPKSRRARDK